MNKLYITITLSIFVFFLSIFSCKNETPTNPDNNSVFENEGEIGTNGGTIQITEPNSKIKGAYVKIPEGALGIKQTIKISDASGLKIPGIDSTAKIIHFEPSGLIFEKSVEIGLPYNKDANYENISAFFIDTKKDKIIQIPILSIDEENGILKASTIHFSDFYSGEKYVHADIKFNIVNSKLKVDVRIFDKMWGIDYGLSAVPVRLLSFLYGITSVKEAIEEGVSLMGYDVISYFKLELKKDEFWRGPVIETRKILVKRIGNYANGFGAAVYLNNLSGEPIVAFETLDSNGREKWFNGSCLSFNFDTKINSSDDYYVNLSWALAGGENAFYSNRYTYLFEFTTKGGDNTYSYNNLDVNNNYIKDNEEPKNKKPTVSITLPANNQHYTIGENVTIKTNASDSDGSISKVEFYVNGTHKEDDSSSPYQYTWNTSGLSEGSYTLKATAIDNDNAKTSTQITVYLDSSVNQKPTISITQPTNNQHFTIGDNVTIKANASDSDGSIAKVKFYINGSYKGDDSSSPYQYSWNTNGLTSGSYTLKTIALDNNNAETVAQITVYLDSQANQKPTISITQPTNNQHFTIGENVTIKATASDADGTISRVKFYVNGTYKGYDTSSPYQYSWNTNNFFAGTYTLKTIAVDNDNLETFAQITVYLEEQSNSAPTAYFTVSPSSGGTSTTFNFDASGSSDNEDPTSSLQVRWDWENDGSWDTNYSTTKTDAHQYATDGIKTIRLEIMDSGGLTNSTTKQLSVINENRTIFQPSDGFDVTLRKANPDNNYGDNTNLVTGTQIAGDSNGLIKFNLNSLPNTVIKVTLNLYNIYGSGHAYNGLTKIYKVLSDWNEHTVTWNNQPTYESNATANKTITNTNGWVSIDITTLYKSWKTNSTNYGMLIDTEGTGYPPGRFYTSDYTEESMKPYLEITR